METSDQPDLYTVLFERGFEQIANFHQSGDIQDLSLAIIYFKQANDISESDRTLLNLGNCLFRRYELMMDVRDLEAAIMAQEKGIALQTEASTVSLNNLGKMFYTQFKLSSSETDLEKALQTFRRAMRTAAAGGPSNLLESARSYAELSLKHRSPSAALDAYRYAMKLIPRLSRAGTPFLSQLRWISNVRECVNGAVAAAIEVGDLELALEWFERGRCVFWDRLRQHRTPLDNLQQVNPALADEIDSILQELPKAEAAIEALADQPIQTPGRDEIRRRGSDLARRLDELVEAVQRLDGFQDFMKQTPKEFRDAAAHGPIVSLNISPNRCDALVLSQESQSIIHVPLPKLTPKKALEMQRGLQGSLDDPNARTRGFRPFSPAARRGLKSVLSNLWLCVVKPILDKLGYLNPMSEPRRITWCASGPLCFLPLHAAGIYSDTDDCSKVFDCAISSYTPSISTLLGAVRKQDTTTGRVFEGPKILAVSQPATPKMNAIPCTVDEIIAVQSVVGKGMTWVNDKKATTSSVLAMMEKHPWVHLACHGVQDLEKSAFMLYDGSVELRTIMELQYDQKELAVLSACQTAMGDDTFPDEYVTLATGMLMAGYRSIVGTMWSIGDKDGPIVMENFYSYLVKEGRGDIKGAAYALHQAVGELRREVGETKFLQWAPFIHVGV
ncbi:hypothetical protein L218DRAFT_926875 [Marasmius fiardii PR-910]|nr:hypothetical protein L218DRAFT_926875 [Marasmius fiardii PR-910]